MKQTLRKFRDTPEDKIAYLACLQKGDGFIANCCSGWPEGYMFHAASCRLLDRYKNKNPLDSERGTGKIWAVTLHELEENFHRRHPDQPTSLCKCLQMDVPEEYDTDMERESHLVVPGGQVESNRSRR